MTNGQQVSDPVPLDGTGHRLPEGDPPITVEVDVYEELDFSVLNIDLSNRIGA